MTARTSTGFVRTLGVLELLAAIGLILPAALGIVPVLVPVTAVCWVLLMVGAIITHLRAGEAGFIVLNPVYLGLAGFVAWGRWDRSPSPADSRADPPRSARRSGPGGPVGDGLGPQDGPAGSPWRMSRTATQLRHLGGGAVRLRGRRHHDARARPAPRR